MNNIAVAYKLIEISRRDVKAREIVRTTICKKLIYNIVDRNDNMVSVS